TLFLECLQGRVPHLRMMRHVLTPGSRALQNCACVSGVLWSGVAAAMVSADSPRPRSFGDSHSCFGCHTRRNRIRQPIEIKDAPMSTIQGLMKFEITNCGTAKETPVTRIAGHTSFMPFQPANAHTTQNGTISENTA